MFHEEYEKRLLVAQGSTRKNLLARELNPADSVTSHSRMPSCPDNGRILSVHPQCDRFIPRRTQERWTLRFPMRENRKHVSDKSAEKCDGEYSCLLKNELLGASIDDVKYHYYSNNGHTNSFFQYSPEKKKQPAPQLAVNDFFPLTLESQSLLRTANKIRQIRQVPYDELDAPGLTDDFYMNLVDWSSQDMLGIGLTNSVNLLNPTTGSLTVICEFSNADTVTSVSWNDRGNYLAIGTHHGSTEVWDVTTKTLMNILEGHTNRVGCLAWNGSILCSGSRDCSILQHDIRTPTIVPTRELRAHQREVCGLRWCHDYQYLASGGSDRKINVWSLNSSSPLYTFQKHEAAVRALAWSPHHRGLLASGGGTKGRQIILWDTLRGQERKSVDTSSQVCSLLWAKYTKEIVSTHGYPEYEISIWKYPELTQEVKLLGHTERVLYLAMSPDGESIVTGAGDETLRFWNIFHKPPIHKESKSILTLFGNIR